MSDILDLGTLRGKVSLDTKAFFAGLATIKTGLAKSATESERAGRSGGDKFGKGFARESEAGVKRSKIQDTVRRAADEAGDKGGKSGGSRFSRAWSAIAAAGAKASADKVASQTGRAGDKAGQAFGSRMSAGMASYVGNIGAMITGKLAGMAKNAFFAGFDRLSNIDLAKTKLTALKMTASQVDDVMKRALAAVRGTAFGMDEAATTAAGAMAAGVKGGQELERYLKIAAGAASIANVPLAEMGVIFNKVQSQGKASRGELDMLNDRGIPVYIKLAEAMGVTTEEVMELASKGKISSKQFLDVMGKNYGDAAKVMGGSFQGTVKNMMASFNRFGANLWSGVFPKLKGVFTGITDAMGPMEDKAKGVGAAIGDAFAKAIDVFQKYFLPAFKAAGDYLVKTAIPAFAEFGKRLGKDVLPDLKALGTAIGTGLLPKLAELGKFLLSILGPSFEVLGKTLGFIIPKIVAFAKWLVDSASWLIPVGSGLAVVAGALALVNFQLKVAAAGGFLKWLLATNKGMALAAGATKAWAAVQVVMNAVLAMSPIGLVVLALAALVTGLVVAYKTSDTFRAVVDNAFAKVRDAAVAVGNFFTTTFPKFFSDMVASIGRRWTELNASADRQWAAFKKTCSDAASGIKSSVLGFIDQLVKGVQGLWTSLSDATARAWAALRDYVVRAAVALRDGVLRPAGELLKRLADIWLNILQFGLDIWARAYTGIVTRAQQIRDGVISRVASLRDGVVNVWKDLSGRTSSFFDTIRKNVVGKVQALKDGAVAVAKGLPNAIGKAISATKDAFTKPFKDAGKWINDNFISKVVGWANNIPGVKLAGGWIKGIPGFEKGGYTGDGGKSDPAGIVHKGEVVWSQNDIKRAGGVKAVEAARLSGQIDSERPGPGMGGPRTSPIRGKAPADQGVWRQLKSWLGSNIPGALVTSAYRRTMTATGKVSNHARGLAVDVVGRGGTSMMSIFNTLRSKFGSKAIELIFSPAGARQMYRGKPHYYSGVTRSNHFDHVHWSMPSFNGVGGGAPGEPGAGYTDSPEKIGGFLDGLRGKFGIAGDILRGALSGITGGLSGHVDSMREWLSDNAGPIHFDGSKTGAPGSGVQRWASTVKRALEMTGNIASDGMIQTVLRRMNQESSGNPRAINNWDSNAKRGTPSKGLMQVIDPTFRANAYPGYSSDIWDPMSNILASMRYAKKRYGNLTSAYNRAGGYRDGTLNATRGYHLVGEAGPEMVHFGGGERVTPAAATATALGGNPDQVAKAIRRELNGMRVDLDNGQVWWDGQSARANRSREVFTR